MFRRARGLGGGAAVTWPALMRLHAAESDDWYCDSRTTYTTLKTERSPTSSGFTRRSSGLDCVKRPGPVATMAGCGARITALLRWTGAMRCELVSRWCGGCGMAAAAARRARRLTAAAAAAARAPPGAAAAPMWPLAAPRLREKGTQRARTRRGERTHRQRVARSPMRSRNFGGGRTHHCGRPASAG